MILKVAQLGQPVLRKPAEEVSIEEIHSDAFQEFLANMEETVRAEKGVGLAAPQVFVSKRVFLACIQLPESEDEPLEFEAFINPRFTHLSEEKTDSWEGCLSFMELTVLVPRPLVVHLEYLDAEGELCRVELEKFPARVVQHEYDHLDGILTVDRAASTRHIVKTSEIKDASAAIKRGDY